MSDTALETVATNEPAVVADPVVVEPAPEVVGTPVAETAPAEEPKRGRGRPRKAAPAAVAPEANVLAKAPPKPAKRKAAVAKPRPAAAILKSKSKPVPVTAPKLAVKRTPVAAAPAKQKETVKMATKTKTTDFTAKFQEAGEKAKAAFGDAGEFAKGNVEAVVASTKILATGVKAMGEAYVAETKSAYETMTADWKALVSVKSPTEFFELQTKLARKNFDAAVATGSKKSEEVLKLANEAFQPISTRFSLAMEKIKQAA